MTVILSRMFQKLGPARRLAAWNSLDYLESAMGGSFPFGTGCSGTDGCCHSLKLLDMLFREQLGKSLNPSHEFAAEKVAWKVRFILQHWSPKRMLGDIWDLSKARSKDIRNGQQVDGKLQVSLALFGVECDSVSGLNCHSRSNRDCVASGSGKTGSTAAATFKHVAEHRPGVIGIENVRNLAVTPPGGGKSNLEVVIIKLNQLGYYACAQMLKTHEYGLPQLRERWWIIGFLVGCEPLDQFAEGYQPPAFANDFTDVLAELQVDPLPLERFLSKDFDCEWAAEFQKSVRPEKKAKVDDNYMVDYLQAYEKAGLQWPPEISLEMEELVKHLPARKQQAVHYWTELSKRAGDHGLGEAREYAVDSNMSCDWQHVQRDVVPCLVSTSSIWLINRRSLLQPNEALALQGFSANIIQDCDPPLSCRQKVDLAGNAFSGSVVGGVVLALVIAGDWPMIVANMQKFAAAKAAKAAAKQAVVAMSSDSDGACEGEAEHGESEDADSDEEVSDFSQ